MAKTSIIHARTDSNHLPSPQPTTTYGISGEQLDAQLQKGMESLRSGRTYSVKEVDEELSKEFWHMNGDYKVLYSPKALID